MVPFREVLCVCARHYGCVPLDALISTRPFHSDVVAMANRFTVAKLSRRLVIGRARRYVPKRSSPGQLFTVRGEPAGKQLTHYEAVGNAAPTTLPRCPALRDLSSFVSLVGWSARFETRFKNKKNSIAVITGVTCVSHWEKQGRFGCRVSSTTPRRCQSTSHRERRKNVKSVRLHRTERGGRVCLFARPADTTIGFVLVD